MTALFMSKYHIVPACLPYTQEDLENFLKRWQGHAAHIHIDCVGEKYAAGVLPTLSWRQEVDLLKEYISDFSCIEFHIMDTGFSRESILAIREALPNVLIFCKEVHHNVCPELKHPYIVGEMSEDCSDALCMTIENIGVQGQEFLYEHVGELVECVTKSAFENIHIDGGVTPDAIKKVVENIEPVAGDTAHKHIYFTIGTYLRGEDYLEKYTDLHNLFPA
ncbi:MAG TPA: hypothetical protein VGE63_00775 [Candidatus Paceibacterota bacterium]